ncbi:matrix metalloproteinase-19-like [Armigeres subalbatus]|uniref:matrix metalloproteinase-19-like n=1 Tax=Armigeres subalbatus TaxID=124917 RepID=UPI002ED3362F
MVLLAVLTVLQCLSKFCLPLPVYINPESIIIKPTLLLNNNIGDHSDVDSNDFPTDPRTPPEVTEQDASIILQEYGYLSTDVIVTRLDQTADESMLIALKQLQQRFNLPDSGTLDDDTRRLIAAPRCGVAELNAVDDKWTKQSLTFRISSYPGSITNGEARRLITQAFNEWTKHVPLSISEVMQGEADIYVSDEQENHQNRLGSDCRFTSNATLAHAFYPQVGDIHYNSGRSYTQDEFFSTTIHEIGHSLGLDHTNSKTSIMFPFHIRYHTEIPPEDRRALQALYGVRKTTSPTTSPRSETSGSYLCSLDRIDTILNDAQGRTYVLAGDYYYDLDERNPQGRQISSKWPKLPGGMDVAFMYRNNKTFFFKRNRVWVYANNQLEAGYPKPIRDDFPGLPNNLSAVFVTKQGSLLAIRKKQYWFYNPRKRPQVGKEFPRLVYDFKDMPSNLNAALRHTDGISYFFKDRSFYIMNMKDYTVGPATPMEQQWFEC